nr:hypothetical protein [uncultured Albidiferax sp.]
MTFEELVCPPVLQAQQALGRYTEQGMISLEFQIGTTLAWFQFDETADEAMAVVTGNELLALAQLNALHAVELAQMKSRKVVPDFWNVNDNVTAKGSRLSIWGVWLDLTSKSITYDVSENHEFFAKNQKSYSIPDVYEQNPVELPEFPDGHHIYLTLTSVGEWSVSS